MVPTKTPSPPLLSPLLPMVEGRKEAPCSESYGSFPLFLVFTLPSFPILYPCIFFKKLYRLRKKGGRPRRVKNIESCEVKALVIDTERGHCVSACQLYFEATLSFPFPVHCCRKIPWRKIDCIPPPLDLDLYGFSVLFCSSSFFYTIFGAWRLFLSFSRQK